jgi:hypothetical protein
MAEDKKNPTVNVSSILSKEGKDLDKAAPKSKAPKAEKKGESKSSDKEKKPKHKHTHVEHHDDGSHTVRHTPAGGGEEVSYAAPDLDAVHDGMEANLGQPNADEGQAQAPEAAPQGAGAEPQPGM